MIGGESSRAGGRFVRVLVLRGLPVDAVELSLSFSTGRMKKALSRSSAIDLSQRTESPPSTRSWISSGSGGAMSMCSTARIGISVAVKASSSSMLSHTSNTIR